MERRIVAIFDKLYLFSLQNILGGSLQNLIPASDRLVKAKSDGSLASSATATDASFSKLKSRSLEPLTGLAMWASEPQIIELMKGERGLGFSILDYQVNSHSPTPGYSYPHRKFREKLCSNDSESSKDSVFTNPTPKSSLHLPGRKPKDHHVRFNFHNLSRFSAPSSVSSGTSSPSVSTSDSLHPFTYHIYI